MPALFHVERQDQKERLRIEGDFGGVVGLSCLGDWLGQACKGWILEKRRVLGVFR